MDHGIDWLGDDAQVEELNLIQAGKQYGWPYVYGADGFNPQDEPPGGISKDEWARLSAKPALGYVPHAAPMQMQFYTGSQFPPDYRGDAFIAMHGSWNRKPPSGYEVVRLRFKDGKPVAFEPFLSGFLSTGAKPEMSGRPFGMAIAKDGALLVGDDLNGAIYRVEYGR
jgi:glucose/arabinose dehydrogenase